MAKILSRKQDVPVLISAGDLVIPKGGDSNSRVYLVVRSFGGKELSIADLESGTTYDKQVGSELELYKGEIRLSNYG